jgi:hypothetical protein
MEIQIRLKLDDFYSSVICLYCSGLKVTNGINSRLNESRERLQLVGLKSLEDNKNLEVTMFSMTYN